MNLLELMIVLILGILIGHVVALLQFNRALRELTKEMGLDLDTEIVKLQKKLEQELKEIFNLETEQISGVLYLYNKENKDFICQGKDIEELAYLAKQYKNIEYATVLHDDVVYTFVNGKAKEFTNENKN